MLEAYLLDWLNLFLRFVHIITGIAWIGASFYFNWLENKIYRVGQRDGIAGSLWAIHGGGYYYLEKYQKYPESQPIKLHWFKWEAYSTWISGFLLLITIYYLNAETYLLYSDATIVVTPAHGVLLSVLGLVSGWLIYDGLCRSSLVRYPFYFLLVILALVPIFAYLYELVFSPKAVFIQLGAMIGTIMVANVFFVIMPVQRKLVQACDEKTPVSSELGLKGYQRSRHNNYFTLPVLLTMISGHYPHLYSTDYNYLVITVVFIVSVLVRHIFNLRGEGKPFGRTIIIAVVFLIAIIVAVMPKQNVYNPDIKVGFEQVREVLDKHCVSCHSANPTQAGFAKPPLGFMVHTDKLAKQGKKLIYQNTVMSRSMPLGNLTKMTDEERGVIRIWYESTLSN